MILLKIQKYHKPQILIKIILFVKTHTNIYLIKSFTYNILNKCIILVNIYYKYLIYSF